MAAGIFRNGTVNADSFFGGAGNDVLKGQGGDDLLSGGAGRDKLVGGSGNDHLYGGEGNDRLFGGSGNDVLEGGAGKDMLYGGAGDDLLLAFSWAGEPVPAQDANGSVNAGEPVADTDYLSGGSGADTFEFRWLIDAKDEILDKHRDANGDVDYSMNGVAGENDNVHDHWVESIGIKHVTDYNPDEDTLVFAGHTVQLGEIEYADMDQDGDIDTILHFVSNQGGNGGAHDGDEVGRVIIHDHQLTADDITVDAGVFYGVEDPYSALG